MSNTHQAYLVVHIFKSAAKILQHPKWIHSFGHVSRCSRRLNVRAVANSFGDLPMRSHAKSCRVNAQFSHNGLHGALLCRHAFRYQCYALYRHTDRYVSYNDSTTTVHVIIPDIERSGLYSSRHRYASTEVSKNLNSTEV